MDFKLQDFSTPMVVTRVANIHYFEFANKYHTLENSHNFCELLYVDKGSITVHSENYSGVMSEKQLIIHRPNELHSLESPSSVAPNVIIIGFECQSSELIPFSYNPVTLSSDHEKILAKILQEGMNIYEPPYDIPNTIYMKKRTEYLFGSDQMVKITLESFLISIVRDFSAVSRSADINSNIIGQNIYAIHQYIKEHYTERITLDNLCFIFGTNKTSLCRDFKSEYGLTILSFINDLRIKEAKTMLRAKENSVTEISEKLGFESIHYFCRVFKQNTGLSPTQYLKSIKGKLNI